MAEITPVTLLTGAVGSGPASLAHEILSNASECRIAVIIDETSGLSADTAQLRTGCLCCTPAAGGTIAALRTLLPRARRDEIAHVLVELRGRPEPNRIKSLFEFNSWVSAAFRLDGVVAVVDASEGLGEVAARAVKAADRVLIRHPPALGLADICKQIQSSRPGIPMAGVMPGADFADFVLHGTRNGSNSRAVGT